MSSESIRNRVLGALAGLLLVLAVAGCGGGGGGSDSSAHRKLIDSLGADGLGKLKSGVVDATMKIGGADAGSGSIHLTGPFGSGAADLTLTASSDLPGLDGDIQGEMVATSDDLFVVADGTTYELGKAEYARLRNTSPQQSTGFNRNFKQACETGMKAQGLDPSVCDQFHPSSWLGEVSDEGSADVAGVNTEHLQAQVDIKTLFTDLINVGLRMMPQASRSQLPTDPGAIADRVGDYIKDFQIDVYRGDDGVPRRLGLSLGVDAPGSSVDFSIDATFAHVNEPQTINPPSGPAQPIRNLAAKLPPPFSTLFACLTTATSQQELQQCGIGAGSAAGALGATGSS
jgi:hypothetical protein